MKNGMTLKQIDHRMSQLEKARQRILTERRQALVAELKDLDSQLPKRTVVGKSQPTKTANRVKRGAFKNSITTVLKGAIAPMHYKEIAAKISEHPEFALKGEQVQPARVSNAAYALSQNSDKTGVHAAGKGTFVWKAPVTA